MASTPVIPGLKEEQDPDFPVKLTPLSKLCDMDIDVFPVDSDEDNDFCHSEDYNEVDKLTPEVGIKFSPIPKSQPASVAGPARDPLRPSRKDNLSFIKREMKTDDFSVTFTRDEKKPQSRPRSFNPYTRMRLPLYKFNPEDFPEDLEMQRKIRRAKITWRHHLRLKKLTLLLSNEIILLRKQNSSLKAKVLELGFCGCPTNVGKGLDLLEDEVPKLTRDHVELEEMLRRLKKEEATIMALDSDADGTSTSTTTTGENNEAQSPSLEDLAKEMNMEVEDYITLHGQKAELNLKSQRDQNQNETMKMKNLGIPTSSSTGDTQDWDREKALLKSQMFKNLGLRPTTKSPSVQRPSSSHNIKFLNQRRFPTPANRIYVPFKRIDIEKLNQAQTPATSLPISKLYFNQLKNSNASLPVTVRISPSGSASAPRKQNLGNRHSYPPKRFISGPASSTSTIVEKEKDVSSGMNSDTITMATTMTTSSQEHNSEEMSKKKQINEKFVMIRGKWFKVVEYADFLRDKIDKKEMEKGNNESGSS